MYKINIRGPSEEQCSTTLIILFNLCCENHNYPLMFCTLQHHAVIFYGEIII